MYKSDISKLVSGEPIKCIVRMKPATAYVKEDVKLIGQSIALVDANNRVVEEFDGAEIYSGEEPVTNIFANSFPTFVSAMTQGFSTGIFAFGCNETGKTQTIEGNKKEPGIALQFIDSLFNLMESKKYNFNNGKNQAQSFNYGVKMRYIEVIDEEITDLLAQPGTTPPNAMVIANEWEGPTITGVNWISIGNSSEFQNYFVRGQKNRNSSSNEFGRLSDKAASILTVELFQTTELIDSREAYVLVSRVNFIDLPGADVLLEDPEALRVKQGSTMNKGITSFATLLKDLATSKGDYVFYDGSIITQLSKDTLGGNSLTCGIFNVANGDIKKSSVTLNFMKYASRVINFPVLNEGKTLGLLKKYRSEIIQLMNMKVGLGDNEATAMRIAELEKKIIQENLDKARSIDDKQRFSQKLSELREKYNQLVKSKADLQSELIKSEEEKLEISKALVELQIENTRLMEVIQNEKYDANNKIINAENDMLSLGMKEEKALKQVLDLQDRLKEVIDEKRELEIEFVALKKNYINVTNDYDNEKLKNENLGVEIINLVNENKALQAEINDYFKRTAKDTEEYERYMKRLEKLDKENIETKEALIIAKSEIERLKNELLNYGVLTEKHKLDLDSRKLEVEKGYLEFAKDRNDERTKLSKDADKQQRKLQDDKLLWESQKIELTHKNKLQARKIQDLEERLSELMKTNEELQSENSKMLIQIDEMRSVYRQKLMQFMSNQLNMGDKGLKVGYDLNAREELIRTYTEKEVDLRDKLETEKHHVKSLRMENKALKNYAKSLKFLAEDWAPVGVTLPDILIKPPPTRLEDDTGISTNKTAEEEILRLRSRMKKLEEELKMSHENLNLQAQNFSKYGSGAGDQKAMHFALMNEIDKLKSGSRSGGIRGDGNNGGDAYSYDQLRKERNDLQEENRRLVSMLKDGKKWDIFLLQRENEKLQKMLREYESNDSVAPISGDTRSLKQKLGFFEKTVKQLEKERSELIVRATMAEEQLKNLQDHLNKTTQEYSKKIYDLKRQIK